MSSEPPLSTKKMSSTAMVNSNNQILKGNTTPVTATMLAEGHKAVPGTIRAMGLNRLLRTKGKAKVKVMVLRQHNYPSEVGMERKADMEQQGSDAGHPLDAFGFVADAEVAPTILLFMVIAQ